MLGSDREGLGLGIRIADLNQIAEPDRRSEAINFGALSWISPLRGFKKIRPKYGKIAHYVLKIMNFADVKIYTIIVPYSYSIHTHISSTIGFTNNSWAY